MSVALNESSEPVTVIKITRTDHILPQNYLIKQTQPLNNSHTDSNHVNSTTTADTNGVSAKEVRVTAMDRSEPLMDNIIENTPNITQINLDGGEELQPAKTFAETAVPKNKSMDDLLPAECLWTSKRDQPVRLRMQKSGPGSEIPITVPSFLKKTVDKIPSGIAMAVKRNGEWVRWTYSEYYSDIHTAAKGFIKLGLEPHKSVGIIGFNAPEWFLADLGAIFAGGLATGIYTTNSPEACQFVAENCEANIIVVENNQQLQKILKVRPELPHLKAIIQYTGEVAVREPNFIYSWSEFMSLAKDVPDSVLEERMRFLAPNKCCMLIYTSGTTGKPKGVMLSHDNITWTANTVLASVKQYLQLKFGELCQVSYLPLSHVAAQLLDIFLTIGYGGAVYFAQPDALKGSLGDTLKEVRPHAFFGVPRVWEKMQEKMQSSARNITGLKKKMAVWAKNIGLRGNYNLMKGERPPLGWAFADKFVFRKVRRLTGLDRCVICLSGAAPITKETLEFFLSLNIPICEVYGMSESSGPHFLGLPGKNRVTSVGQELRGISTKLANKDSEGNGEIIMQGRHVFMGYLHEEEKTRETLDANDDLCSGDIGKQDSDGYWYITGRIKEIIITAGGENVAPVPIEEMVKETLHIVSQCMLVGDKKKFLSMLITLKTEVNPDTLEAKDELTELAMDWCRSVGSNAKTVTDIVKGDDKAVLKAVQAGIDHVNSKAVSNAQKIQKWSILPKDFSIPGGELGPTMKLRRPIIHKMYVKTINAFYEEGAEKPP